MLRPFLWAVCGVVICAGGLLAFEVDATIKTIDVEKGVVVFTADQKHRAVKVLRDVKVLDAEGKELADGLKAKDLKEGTAVTLTVERQGKANERSASSCCSSSRAILRRGRGSKGENGPRIFNGRRIAASHLQLQRARMSLVAGVLSEWPAAGLGSLDYTALVSDVTGLSANSKLLTRSSRPDEIDQVGTRRQQ